MAVRVVEIVRLREEPDVKALNPNGSVVPSDNIEAIDKDGQWIKIRVFGLAGILREGWVLSDFIEEFDQTEGDQDERNHGPDEMDTPDAPEDPDDMDDLDDLDEMDRLLEPDEIDELDRSLRTASELQKATAKIDLSQKIAFGRKVDAAFKSKLIRMCARLGCDPNHMMAAMAFETGETFSPSKQNRQSRATGLIQFIPSTARSLGTSTSALAKMSAVEQLSVVERYFKPHTGKMNSLSDLYMAILFPVAVGKSESFVLFKRPQIAFKQNKGLDTNRDGRVTKGEATTKVQHKLQRGLSSTLIG